MNRRREIDVMDPLEAAFRDLEDRVAHRERLARQAKCGHSSTLDVTTHGDATEQHLCADCGAVLPLPAHGAEA